MKQAENAIITDEGALYGGALFREWQIREDQYFGAIVDIGKPKQTFRKDKIQYNQAEKPFEWFCVDFSATGCASDASGFVATREQLLELYALAQSKYWHIDKLWMYIDDGADCIVERFNSKKELTEKYWTLDYIAVNLRDKAERDYYFSLWYSIQIGARLNKAFVKDEEDWFLDKRRANEGWPYYWHVFRAVANEDWSVSLHEPHFRIDNYKGVRKYNIVTIPDLDAVVSNFYAIWYVYFFTNTPMTYREQIPFKYPVGKPWAEEQLISAREIELIDYGYRPMTTQYMDGYHIEKMVYDINESRKARGFKNPFVWPEVQK